MMGSHDDAINAALLALGAALTELHPDPDKADGARFVLQQLRADDTQSLVDLQDKQVSITGDVLIQLLIAAIKVPLLESQKADALSCRDASWDRLRKARTIMKKPGRHDAKARQALFSLGLVGEDAGKGGNRVNHRAIASHYHLLRTGGNYFENGKLIGVKPHSFTDAFNAIGKRYSPDKELDWDSLVKACRRKKIPLKKKAEVYPVD